MANTASLAELLELEVAGPMPLLSAVRHGLPVRTLDGLARQLAPEDQMFAFRIVPRATLARRRKETGRGRDGRLSPEESTRLARVASVWAMALEVWGDEDAARRFMFDPHPLLDGRRPIDVVLENELGRPVVEGILGRLKFGSAV